MLTDDQQGRLGLDYSQTTGLLRDLTDVRFKLLAFVPTITGAAVALLSHKPSAAELLAVGVLGLVATTGVVLYELRNTQVYDYALRRAQHLEAQLGFVSAFHPPSGGGLFRELPGRDMRLFGLAEARHDRGLALVYSAAIGGWSYLIAWGALNALRLQHAQQIGLAIGALAGILVLFEFLRKGGLPAGADSGAELPARAKAQSTG
jgi:hypothetical protein